MKEIKVVTNVLKANDKMSVQNREIFDEHSMLVMNMIGSPGAGKTTLLEALVEQLKNDLKIAVIEGDIFTTRDAERMEKHGIEVVQINTGGGCHLDAAMVQDALSGLNLNELDLLVIENVGNLICPAAWNLGEDFKMVVMSITEGDDKPEKYYRIFQESRVMVVSKIDLLEYNNFDMERFINEVKGIHPEIVSFQVSSTKGDGLEKLSEWIYKQHKLKKY